MSLFDVVSVKEPFVSDQLIPLFFDDSEDPSPDDITSAGHRLSTSLRVLKANRSHRLVPKTIVVDSTGMMISYSPSRKDSSDVIIFLHRVHEIRVGGKTLSARKVSLANKCNPRDIISILTACGRVWDFVVDPAEQVSSKSVAQALHMYVQIGYDLFIQRPMDVLAHMLWAETDRNNDKKVTFSEIKPICHKLNMGYSVNTLLEAFRSVDRSHAEHISFEEFVVLMKQLRHCPALHPLFVKYSTKGKFTAPDVRRFLTEHQFGDTLDNAEYILSKYGDTAGDFADYLTDPVGNSWLKPKCSTVHMDMTHPLRDYYIKSSHNTYLVGDQLTSESSTLMYRYSLLQGYRCVEIDCWDGPTPSDPIVYHGYTCTSKILFRDVIREIRLSAFVNNPYPVILSLEVHCSMEQQQMMAKILLDELEDVLLLPNQIVGEITPENAKHKILIKNKRSGTVILVEDDLSSPTTATKKKALKKQASVEHDVARELSDLVTVPSISFETAMKGSTETTSCVSLSETRITSLMENSEEDILNVTRNVFVRVYPSGARINSSNYHPQQSWIVGAQIVALNVQTKDYPCRYNDSKFIQNGGCGYILKPKYLRHSSTHSLSKASHKRYVLHVRVLLGRMIPKPNLSPLGEIIDPYVILFVTGRDPDNSPTFTTKYVDDNGFNPIYQQMFSFVVHHIEMAVLTVRVIDKDVTSSDDEVAEASLPLSCLRLGYRTVPLRNVVDNQPLPFSGLLCHFSLENCM